MEVIHYSKEPKFKLKPIEIKNGALLKPYGGIWASPIETKYGWKQWCEIEHFGNIGAKHKFKMDIDTKKFITINDKSDLDNLPWYTVYENHEAIDFEALKKRGIEGIHLTDRGQAETRLAHPRNMYGWDCESVLIMNERCIKKIEKVG